MTSLRTTATIGTALTTLILVAATSAHADNRRAELELRIDALHQELESLQTELDTLPDDPVSPLAEQPDLDPVALEAQQQVEQRRELERDSARNPLSITAYRRNYLLPISYNSTPNEESFRLLNEDGNVEDVEVKFQFSAKVNLVEGLFDDRADLYFAYTQRSWWQAYNSDASAPFRETNYEPEMFLDFDNNWQVLGWTNTRNRLAFNHLSNGRSGDLSRSWNRLYLDSLFQRGDWALSIAPHWRIPESESDDDNPDIQRYVGYGDITLARRFNNDHEASLLVRGNPSAGNMGSQIDYSWPMFGSIRGHIQYYAGYGESMIDYDSSTNRLSIGFSLNPLFAGQPEQ